MAKSKVSSKDTNWQASSGWLKPYKLHAIKLFKELDGLAKLFGTRKRLWSKNIIKKGRFRELAKAIYMDYDELKAELERIELERQRDARRNKKMKQYYAKYKELEEAGRDKEAFAILEEMFDKFYCETTESPETAT